MLHQLSVTATAPEAFSPAIAPGASPYPASGARHWYALYTRHHFEKQVESDLRKMGLQTYLPVRRVLRQWSDRKKWLEEPLFSCYVFVNANAKERFLSLTPNGVVRMLSNAGEPSRIPDTEIETVRRLVDAAEETAPVPQVVPGDLLEIIGGPLSGVRGCLQEIHGEHRLVVSFETIGRSLAIKVDRDRVRKVAAA